MTARRMETKLISIGVADNIHYRMIAEAPQRKDSLQRFPVEGTAP